MPISSTLALFSTMNRVVIHNLWIMWIKSEVETELYEKIKNKSKIKMF